jgi:hypothetical protein
MGSPSIAVSVALVGGIVTAFGWIVTNYLTTRRDESRLRLEAQQKFLERQIEELYGPLTVVLHEGRRTFKDLCEIMGRENIFENDGPLSKEDQATWLFWADADFFPRNEFIRTLLKTKAHLIEGPEFPKSYVDFLDHCNSWSINHLRWKVDQIPYPFHSKIDWPDHFEEEVIATANQLKLRHSNVIGTLRSAN